METLIIISFVIAIAVVIVSTISESDTTYGNDE